MHISSFGRNLIGLTICISVLQSLHAFVPTCTSSTRKLLSVADSDLEEISSEPKLEKEIGDLKESLLTLASLTKRGFVASKDQRREASSLVSRLSLLNPTLEPASSYYDSEIGGGDDVATIAGKWTLVYTDAPDITSLDPTNANANNPFFPTISTAKLGRIGQECIPEQYLIKNVIEWERPDWLSSLSVAGKDGARVLQKVCCEAKADASRPTFVDLKLIGLDLVGADGNNDGNDKTSSGNTNMLQNVMEQIRDGPAEFLSRNPIELRGPLKAPFGRFEILYLDKTMRIIRTGQGFLAVNIRDEEEWF